MLSKQSFVTPRGVTDGRIDVYNYGPGFSKVWFSGIVDAINIATTTPIDDETTQVRFNFVVRKFDDEKLTSTVADAFVKEINKQVQEDRPIWEHKAFLPTPALADTDGPIMQVPQVVQPVLRGALRTARLNSARRREGTQRRVWRFRVVLGSLPLQTRTPLADPVASRRDTDRMSGAVGSDEALAEHRALAACR